MFNKDEHIKKLNMKVAGTILKSNKPNNNSQKINNKEANATEDDASSLIDEDSSLAGLTAKQKQNRRKKL